MQAIETNSYPFSTPMLSEDGDMLVYLSDADSTDVTDTEVRFSRSSGGSFPDGTAIPDGADGFSGYGDSAPDFDGTGAFAGAVWLREAATLGLKAGTELNEGQQTILLNGLEVMASLWNGREWVTTRLTDNGSQEFDPVIAAADGKAIAVWRAVQTDESAFDFTHNRILCRIYDGTKWNASLPDTEISHSSLTGLTTGDAGHTQFVMLAGRAGGQTVQGGTAASETLVLESTAHATKGIIYLKDKTNFERKQRLLDGWYKEKAQIIFEDFDSKKLE